MGKPENDGTGFMYINVNPDVISVTEKYITKYRIEEPLYYHRKWRMNKFYQRGKHP